MSTDPKRLPAPHPGAQTLALSVDADLVLYGGRAGTGKTFTLGMYPFHFLRRGWPANIKLLRLNTRDIRDAGGTFDTMSPYWVPSGAIARRGQYPSFTWELPRGSMRISLRGLDQPGKERTFQGQEIDLYLLEELGEFSAASRESQIFWLMSRHRSGMGVGFRPMVYATLNPCSGWIRRIVDWWIGSDGQPIWSRSGQVRWMIRKWVENLNGTRERVFEFADTREELMAAFPAEDPISVTLVSASRKDNPYTDWADYERRLRQLDPHERERLLDGNWDARPVDPSRIYHPGPSVIVSPEGQAWADVVELSRRHGVRHLGGWDYGRAKALAWVGGVLVPGRPTCLWITNAILFPDMDAAAAAAIRIREHVDRDRGLIYASTLDFGDPAGRARDSGAGWAATLRQGGVPLSELSHLYGEGREFYWNSHPGRAEIRALVKTWMNTGRLRVLSDVLYVTEALENWRLKVPTGVSPVDVDAEHVQPQKDRHSHIADALGYLVAGTAEMLRIEAAEAHEPAADLELPLEQRRLLLNPSIW